MSCPIPKSSAHIWGLTKMLEVKGLSVAYGKHRALESVSLHAAPGEIVVILGANGAGKSTLLKSISGICEGRVSGSATMNGEPLLGQPPHKVVERGVALVPEGRGVFGDLTVRDNLMLGANPQRAREEAQANYDRLIGLFPKLAERAGQTVRTMSGGEQQMVAIGRAMMSNPMILMLDEPSLGLSPLLSKELFQNLKAVREAGLGILLVEQNARLSLGVADRGYLLENGQILREDKASVLRNDPAVQAAYLGGDGSGSAPAPRAATVAPARASQPSAPSPSDAAAATPRAPMPPAVTARQKSAVTIPASHVVGLDISSLVARAGQQAQPARKPVSQVRSPSAAPGPARDMHSAATPRSDALTRMLADMEAAARNAAGGAGTRRAGIKAAPLPPLRPSIRARMPLGRPPADISPPVQRQAQPSDDAASLPLPDSRVTIYRRRPGTSQFEPTER